MMIKIASNDWIDSKRTLSHLLSSDSHNILWNNVWRHYGQILKQILIRMSFNLLDIIDQNLFLIWVFFEIRF